MECPCWRTFKLVQGWCPVPAYDVALTCFYPSNPRSPADRVLEHHGQVEVGHQLVQHSTTPYPSNILLILLSLSIYLFLTYILTSMNYKWNNKMVKRWIVYPDLSWPSLFKEVDTASSHQYRNIDMETGFYLTPGSSRVEYPIPPHASAELLNLSFVFALSAHFPAACHNLCKSSGATIRNSICWNANLMYENLLFVYVMKL
jgi:hypothetical protein